MKAKKIPIPIHTQKLVTVRSNGRLTSTVLFSLALLFFSILGCQKDPDVAIDQVDSENGIINPSDQITSRAGSTYELFNLVSDEPDEYPGAVNDSKLVNAWGLAIGPSQEFWVAATGSDYALVYGQNGHTLRPPLEVEGEPIGVVYNTTSSFKIPGTTKISRYLFATEYGTVQAWNPWNVNTVTTVIDNAGGNTAYTGIEIAKSQGKDYIYLANVGEGKIDVYDKNFNWVNMSFSDPTLPAGASPFNIRLINDKLYVTYVGPGGGYVNIFKTDGSFVKRFATGGTLAAPWGITKAPGSFGLGNVILVGNFGDGRINIYGSNGQYLGQLNDENNSPIEIDGLWALSFVDPNMMGGYSSPKLYFTAGPDEEEHGLFGYLQKN